MSELNQVYEQPEFDFKKFALILGSASILGLAMFLTFILRSNTSNLSLQPSRAERRRPETPTKSPSAAQEDRRQDKENEPVKPIVTKEDLDSAINEIDSISTTVSDIERSKNALQYEAQ